MLRREALVYDLGTVKLADFGLSKTLPVNKHAGFDLDSKFKLTGETGSYRFMAREVFVHEAYNNKVGPIPGQASCQSNSISAVASCT